MPEWVKDVIREAHPPSDENLDDLQSDLQKLLDEFRLPTPTYSKSLKSTERTDQSDEGLDEAEKADLDPLANEEDRFLRGEGHSGNRATSKKIRKAPEGAKLSKEAQALERAPTIEILRELSEIEAKGIKGRAGKYYRDAQTLFVNGLYSAVDRMTSELELHFAGRPNQKPLEALFSQRHSGQRPTVLVKPPVMQSANDWRMIGHLKIWKEQLLPNLFPWPQMIIIRA